MFHSGCQKGKGEFFMRKTEKGNTIAEGHLRRQKKTFVITIGLLLLLLGLSVLLLTYGNTVYSLKTVMQVLGGADIEGATYAVMTLRLPRLLIGLLAGLAFGIAGNTFQTILRNDLASPDIIGVTSGSSVAAVFCILVLGMSGAAVSFVALFSGLIVATAIYLLSSGNGFSKSRMILIGIGMQALFNAVISFIILKSAQYDVPTALRWLNGSLNGVQMDRVPLLFFVVLLVGTAVLVLTRHLQVLQLGEDMASTLGLKVNSTYLILIFASVVLVAFATSVSGPIASIAFLSGPIAARLVGKGGVNTIPAGLVGAVLVLAADFFGQYALATRYPVGVITGVLGAPYMLLLLIRMNRKGESV